jgi:hypothetical protein
VPLRKVLGSSAGLDDKAPESDLWSSFGDLRRFCVYPHCQNPWSGFGPGKAVVVFSFWPLVLQLAFVESFCHLRERALLGDNTVMGCGGRPHHVSGKSEHFPGSI